MTCKKRGSQPLCMLRYACVKQQQTAPTFSNWRLTGSPYHVQSDPATSIPKHLCISDFQVEHALRMDTAEIVRVKLPHSVVVSFRSQLTMKAGVYLDYRESMHVIIASLDLAPRGKGD